MAPIPPAPGAAKPGDLYVDLQSRALWLGVTEAVDPLQAVLVSDIEGTYADIAASVAAANSYTDSRIDTRAPSVHSHPSSQITDFVPAVTAVVAGLPDVNWVTGMVIMWSGSLSSIGVGDLAGWALCDGGNGTPNLRDKFILGAGNKLPGAVNPQASLETTGGGTHTHTINGTVLTVSNLPAHSHGGNTGYVSHNHTHGFSVVTDAQGNHQHTGLVVKGSNSDNGDAGSLVITTNGEPNGNQSNAGWTNPAGAHQHNVSGNTGGISENHYHAIPAEGGNQAHAHTIVGGGGIHEHTVTSAALRDTIPYFALAFIMKL